MGLGDPYTIPGMVDELNGVIGPLSRGHRARVQPNDLQIRPPNTQPAVVR